MCGLSLLQVLAGKMPSVAKGYFSGNLTMISPIFTALWHLSLEMDNQNSTQSLAIWKKEEGILLAVPNANSGIGSKESTGMVAESVVVNVIARFIKSRPVKQYSRVQGTKYCLFDMDESFIAVWNLVPQNHVSISELCYTEPSLFWGILLNKTDS